MGGSSRQMTDSLGLDFGTTNTVATMVNADGRVEAMHFRHDDTAFDAFRSVLCFSEADGSGRRTNVTAGPWAIDKFVEQAGDCRFIQSFKTFAASALFADTLIYNRRYRFEDLLTNFLEQVRTHAGVDFPRRVVIGRPVSFAGAAPDEALARARYEVALRTIGFEEIHHVYEPVAAAYYFAQRLNTDATILVADFGGGTSDFSVLRFEPGGSGVRARPLGHAGIGIAGDTFDYRFIDKVVSPRLGKSAHYRSFGKSLPIPGHFFANFARWNQLSMMKANGDLKELCDLARSADQREELERFIEIIEYDLGFELYRSVSATKRALSGADSAPFVFRSGGVDIAGTVTRAAFESWIADDVARIAETLRQALDAAGTPAAGIDRVFLTGGTSLIPAIRRLFVEQFGAERLSSGAEFESIASGLALIGHAPDLQDWTAG